MQVYRAPPAVSVVTSYDSRVCPITTRATRMPRELAREGARVLAAGSGAVGSGSLGSEVTGGAVGSGAVSSAAAGGGAVGSKAARWEPGREPASSAPVAGRMPAPLAGTRREWTSGRSRAGKASVMGSPRCSRWQQTRQVTSPGEPPHRDSPDTPPDRRSGRHGWGPYGADCERHRPAAGQESRARRPQAGKP